MNMIGGGRDLGDELHEVGFDEPIVSRIWSNSPFRRAISASRGSGPAAASAAGAVSRRLAEIPKTMGRAHPPGARVNSRFDLVIMPAHGKTGA